MNAIQNRKFIHEIQTLLRQGKISYQEAVDKITPMVKAINMIGKKLAKKHRITYRPVSVSGVLR